MSGTSSLWERACPAKRPAQTTEVNGQGFALIRGTSPLPPRSHNAANIDCAVFLNGDCRNARF